MFDVRLFGVRSTMFVFSAFDVHSFQSLLGKNNLVIMGVNPAPTLH